MKKILLKHKYCLLLGLFLLALNNAKANEDMTEIVSDYKSNVAARVASLGSNKFFATEELAFGFLYTGTNNTTLYFFPGGSRRDKQGYTSRETQYACKLEMIDEKGVALCKKPIALKMESYFMNETNWHYPEDVQRLRKGKDLTPYFLGASRDGAVGGGSLRVAYAPDELFDIPKKGNYTMTLTFQVMKKRSEYNSPLILITLPPLKIPVIKQEDKKPTNQNIQTNSEELVTIQSDYNTNIATLLTSTLATPNHLIHSDYKSNIAVCIAVSNTNKIFTTDILDFGFSYTGTNDTYLFFFPNPNEGTRRDWRGYPSGGIQYVCKLEMVDKKGVELNKKPIALKMKSYFMNETNLLYKDNLQQITKSKYLHPYMLGVSKDGTVSNGVLYTAYTPDELFEIPKKGNYTMTLTFQVMKFRVEHIYPMILITLPPVKIPVIKLEDEKPTNQNNQTNSIVQ